MRTERRQQCKDCLAAKQRRWREAHLDHARTISRKSELHRKFGLNAEDYDAMLAMQGGVCAICGTTEPGVGNNGGARRFFAVDHDHTTGRVRGLLCNRCNRVLGHFNDDAVLLAKAAAYLGYR